MQDVKFIFPLALLSTFLSKDVCFYTHLHRLSRCGSGYETVGETLQTDAGPLLVGDSQALHTSPLVPQCVFKEAHGVHEL